MSERIVAEALSRFGSVRVTIDLDQATIHVERWHRPGSRAEAREVLSAEELTRLRALASEVRQEEEQLIVGDFYADGEERLRISLGEHAVELHNGTDRIRTPKASVLLDHCYALADGVLPRS